MHLAIELDDKKVIQKYHKEFTDLETQIHEYVDAFEDLCISKPSVAIRYEMEAVIMATVASLHDTSEEYIQQVLLDSAELTVDQLIASEYHNTADYDKEYLLDVYLDAVRGYLKELAV